MNSNANNITDSKENKKQRVERKVMPMINTVGVKSDPSGSYTGIPIDKNEMPTQDADDL